MKNFLLCVFILLSSISGFSQVHKLTYREAYNFNVGDEIYYTEEFNGYEKQVAKIITEKFVNKSADTIFYKAKFYTFIVLNYNSNMGIANPGLYIKTYDSYFQSFFITHLNDTIVKLNGVDTLYKGAFNKTILRGSHYSDSICHLKTSTISKSKFEYYSNDIYIMGCGGFFSLVYDAMQEKHLQLFNGYKKGIDSCGNCPLQLKNAMQYAANCYTAREMFDVNIGDEYIFERVGNDFPTELVYRKVADINYYNSNKSLKINYNEKIISKADIENCSCVKESIFSINILNLDTCFIENDYQFDYNLDNHLIKSMINLSNCILNNNQYFLLRRIQVDDTINNCYYYVTKNIWHIYFKGVGFLSTINHFTEFNPNRCIDRTSSIFNDTSEILTYVNNKSYQCGNLSNVFSPKTSNSALKYLTILSNPIKIGNDILCYNSSSTLPINLTFINPFGATTKSVEQLCTEKSSMIRIPAKFFHTGLNIVSFQFDDGHQEIHKIIVY